MGLLKIQNKRLSVISHRVSSLCTLKQHSDIGLKFISEPFPAVSVYDQEDKVMDLDISCLMGPT